MLVPEGRSAPALSTSGRIAEVKNDENKNGCSVMAEGKELGSVDEILGALAGWGLVMLSKVAAVTFAFGELSRFFLPSVPPPFVRALDGPLVIDWTGEVADSRTPTTPMLSKETALCL
eukprot:GILK01031817.1.p2 GENE.GILK01031817.1~~GILK01031817.1.p2  ORF type:complete len:118 (-),score=5.18 GILK01031817.1:91-444(-)